MAIKIISKGTKEAKTYIRTCPECGCTYSYTWKDATWNNNSGGYMSISCPQCGYPVAHIMGGSSGMNTPE